MVRLISKDKYIVAAIITFLIFSLGILLGLVLEDHRYALVEEAASTQEVDYLSLQLQQLYLNNFHDEGSCPVLSTALKKAVVDLDQTLSQVIAFEEDQSTASQRKETVQRRYILDNLRYWLLAKESQQKCHLDIVPILYFYSTSCPSCPNQGTILSYFKNLFGEKVLVFPINLDLQEKESMVDVAVSLFNIQKTPSLIINDKKYEGVVPQEKVQEIICSTLQDASPCQK